MHPVLSACAAVKGLIDLSSGVNWLERPNADGPCRWGRKVRAEGPAEETGTCQSSETATSKSLAAPRQVFKTTALFHLSDCVHTYRFAAHYDAGDANERWE